MRAIALLAAAVGIAGSMSAQEIRNVRIDFGYGTAPALHNPGPGFRGIHANVAAETPWGDFGLLYLSRIAPSQLYGPGNEQSASTIALQIEKAWRSSRGQFTISGGLGIFSAKNTFYSYDWPTNTSSVFTETYTRIAFPVGMRMCWYFTEHFGAGAAILGAYVPDNSYGGLHLFVRVGL